VVRFGAPFFLEVITLPLSCAPEDFELAANMRLSQALRSNLVTHRATAERRFYQNPARFRGGALQGLSGEQRAGAEGSVVGSVDVV
jgi:hypothetical protein